MKTNYSDDQILRLLFCKFYDDENISVAEWEKVKTELTPLIDKFWNDTEKVLSDNGLESTMGMIFKKEL